MNRRGFFGGLMALVAGLFGWKSKDLRPYGGPVSINDWTTPIIGQHDQYIRKPARKTMLTCRQTRPFVLNCPNMEAMHQDWFRGDLDKLGGLS